MRKEDILANCVDEILAGHSTVADCVSRYPELGGKLRQLLEIAMTVPPEAVTPSPEFRWQTRRHLLALMAARSEPRGAGRGFRLPARALGLSTMIITLLMVSAGGGTVYAAQSSLPDDTLYPVKTGMERLQIAITLTREARANLHLKLAQRRIDEVLAQSNLNRDPSAAALTAMASQIDSALQDMNGAVPENTLTFLGQLLESTLNQQVILDQMTAAAPPPVQPALEQALDVTRRGNIIAQVAYNNPDFLNSSPSVLDKDLETSQFKLEGTLLKVDGRTWDISGLLIENVESPHTPPVGNPVKLEGVVRGKEIFISNIHPQTQAGETVRIEGRFGGTDPTGNIWYIGGIPVGITDNNTPPAKGTSLALQGNVREGNVLVTRVEDENEDKVKLGGVLSQVNSDQGTIAVSVAGAQVTFNVGEAQLKTKDGQPLTMTDLKSMVGEDIKVNGIHKKEKDDRFFAREAKVERENDKSSQKETEPARSSGRDGGDRQQTESRR